MTLSVTWSPQEHTDFVEEGDLELMNARYKFQRAFYSIVFEIKSGPLHCQFIYYMWKLTPEELQRFVTAMEQGGQARLGFVPGSNSSCGIDTDNGETSFYLDSAGGDAPCSFTVALPNCDELLRVFKDLLSE